MYVLELAGEDDALAACEAASGCSGVARLAPGLASATNIDRIESLAFTRRASVLLGHTDAAVEAARTRLTEAAIDRRGTVAVRARDVRGTAGVDTQRAERELGAVLTRRGFDVDLDDPDHELRALFSDDSCALGWLVARSVRDFGDRMPSKRPFFQPGSMGPLLARALANIAGARPGARVLDPMCGTGGLLIESGLAGADVIGLDAQPKMTQGTRDNLTEYLGPDAGTVLTGTATRLPFEADTIDGVVFDAPYGRQSKIVDEHSDGSLSRLVSATLEEANRVAPRAVLVADRPWEEAATSAGWTVETTLTRRVHASLTRRILVLTTNDRSGE
ncbi:methyltransferase domain-containing protein [Halocatena pleomorpha]|uniref:tRNA (guanine(10)-N(2))-dimethyltransferase n=1 Tax=Halocatena pleomorpha TaxID=1785090 RepID=A0A3P3R776_9EURY|nr:methyltransferase domain-containing protein [Halocatena pleomorpha]RRJ28403.1 methyltransferase domain-containing protein [Halocatena pleomorpha]